MPQNFLSCDRDQAMLLPPSLSEWLPDGHLARFVIDAVAALDWGRFMPRIGRMGAVVPRMTRR
jgi:hypothetical protein